MLTFAGTSYLSMSDHPDFLAWLGEGLARHGTHYGGSRRSALAPEVYARAEAGLAQWTGAPAALLASSGTLAGQWATQQLLAEGHTLHYAPGAHPALWQPGGRHYAHQEAWVDGVCAALDQGQTVAAVTDSVSALYATRPQWDWLAQVSPQAPLTLLIDDSHALGVLGPGGSGSWGELRSRWPGRLWLTASLAKAFAIPGGLVCANHPADLDNLRHTPQYGGASPPPPAYLYAWLQAQALLRRQHQHLLAAVAEAEAILTPTRGFVHLPGFPVFCTSRHHLAGYLATHQIAISQFHYPGPHDPLLTRVVVQANHRGAALEKLAAALKNWPG